MTLERALRGIAGFFILKKVTVPKSIPEIYIDKGKNCDIFILEQLGK